MPSIQSLISKNILAGIFLVAVVTGIIIDEFTHQQFNAQFNKTLEHKAWTLATLNDQKYGVVEFDFADEMMPEFEASENAEYFELWLGNGELLEKSRSLGDKDLPLIQISLNESVFQDIELPDGQPGRLVAIHFTPQLDDEIDDDDEGDRKSQRKNLADKNSLKTVTLVIAKNRTELKENLLLNRMVIIVSLLSMLMISYLIIHHAVKKGLSPLTALSREVQNMDDQSLDTELNTSIMYSELSTITLQLNNLFSRLNSAFNREKRFSSNVSHELRTPIAELMTLSDVGKSCVDNPEMTEQFFFDAKDIAQNMNEIVETLLTLAQSESGMVSKNFSVFNLHDCIQTSIKKVNLININNLEVVWDRLTANSIQVYSDWEKLIPILTNIISNAFKYSPPESAVSINMSIQEQKLSLSISNPNTDLIEADLKHLTENFWRKDEARTGGKNTGLGLTLVEKLCQVINVSLSFDLNEDQVFTVTLGNLSVHQYNIDS